MAMFCPWNNVFTHLVVMVTLLRCSFSSNISSSSSVLGRASDAEIRHTLKMIMNEDYDKRIRPNISGDPVIVAVDFSAVGFSEVQEVNMAYKVDMFFRQVWIDPRLRHNLSHPITLTMGTGHPADHIWVPDTIFENAFSAHLHNVLVSNHKLDIYPNGKVFWGTRATVRAMCHMDLKTYPLDTQKCALLIVSYAYTGTDLLYKWRSHPGVVFLDRDLAQFYVTNVETEERLIKYVAGSYSVLEARFLFKRRLGYYVIQIYIPCIFIVLISTMSFWVDKNATPARIGLSITTLLTISTLWGSLNSTMPRVSYPKATDWYLMVSFAFVFASLLEYIAVLHLHKLGQKIKTAVSTPALHKTNSRRNSGSFLMERMENGLNHDGVHKRQFENGAHDGMNSNGTTTKDMIHYKMETETVLEQESSCCHISMPGWTNFDNKTKGEKYKEKDSKASSKIDVYSRVLFPMAFGLFNVIYWLQYLKEDGIV